MTSFSGLLKDDCGLKELVCKLRDVPMFRECFCASNTMVGTEHLLQEVGRDEVSPSPDSNNCFLSWLPLLGNIWKVEITSGC